MRAGFVTGQRKFELAEVGDPEPHEGQVVIAITRCGICGSDVHAYREGWAYPPGICGHEWVGTVVAVGPGMSDQLAVEELRVVAGQAPGCGTCAECRADHSQFCRLAVSSYSGRNAPASGGFAPFMALDANRLVPIPDELSDDEAALIEPAAVAMHAVRKSRLSPGDIACVVGCGPIGLMTVQCARISGARAVIAVEPSEARRQRALILGADYAVAPGEELRSTIDDLTGGLRADIAFDCAGVPETLQQSVDMVRKGGSVCMVGVSSATTSIEPMRWMMKEVSVDTSIVHTLNEMSICADLLATGRLLVSGIVADTITLDELPSMFEHMADGKVEALKILVDPTAG